jgi:hypothetical protein
MISSLIKFKFSSVFPFLPPVDNEGFLGCGFFSEVSMADFGLSFDLLWKTTVE